MVSRCSAYAGKMFDESGRNVAIPLPLRAKVIRREDPTGRRKEP